MTRDCGVCKSAKKKTIENAIRRGSTSAQIANTYGLARKTIRVHAAKHMGAPVDVVEGEPAARAIEPISKTPTPAKNDTPHDKAKANAASALEALQKAERESLPLADVTRLRSAYIRSLELEAKTSKLSVESILKSEAWGELLKQVTASLADHPEAVRALHAAFRR